MMNRTPLPRRTFLVDATRVVVAGWLTVELQLLVGCARDAGTRDADFNHLNAAEVRTLRAFAAQILPSDTGSPGVAETGIASFVVRAFGVSFFADSVAMVRSGLADLDARAKATSGGRDFASAPDAAQIAIMRAVEATPFFANMRTLIITGTLADPSYGGNRDGAGWALLGVEHRPSFTAPFGWYDAQPALAGSSGAS